MVQHPFRRKSPYLEPVEEGKNPTPEIPGAEGNPAEKPEEAGQPFVPSPMPDTASKNTKEETPARPVGGALQKWQAIKGKVDKFADDKWMDAMAEHPRVKKYAAQMDEIVHFMTKREYKTGNPAMDAVRGPVVLGVWLFLFVFVFLLGWSLLAPLSSAAVAAGSVVLDTNKKVIQHLEGGIIEEILVKEGEYVKEGQPLIRLNQTTAQARQEILENQLRTAEATLARLIAERDGKEEIEFPDDLVNQADNSVVAELLASQQQLFESRRGTVVGQLDILDQRIHQLENEISGLDAQQKAAKEQMDLIDEEIGTVKALVAKGQALKPRLLQLQRAAAQLAGERGDHLANISRAKQAIGENKLEALNTKNKYMSEVVQQIRETQDSLSDLKEKARASEDVLSRITITAPQSGIVNNIRYHTKGGVIQPGAPIMDLVPQNERLIVEAQVLPQDIDVVHAKLKAKVRLSAYKTRTTPLLEGVVETVSADRINDEKSGRSFYIARVVIDEKELKELKDVELYPGMPADVLIITGERTLFSYLMTPFMQAFFKAFREQ